MLQKEPTGNIAKEEAPHYTSDKNKMKGILRSITASNSGDCRALERNSEILPSFRLLICKQSDCRGVLNISGN